MLRFSEIMFKLGGSVIVGGGGVGVGNSNSNTAPDTNDVPPSALAKNLKALDHINNLVSTANESYSNELKPFLVQIQGITSNARRKLLNDSKKVDGFAQDALARNCFDDCFLT